MVIATSYENSKPILESPKSKRDVSLFGGQLYLSK